MAGRLYERLSRLERAQLGPGAALSVFFPGVVLRLDGGRVVFTHDTVLAALAPTDAEMDAAILEVSGGQSG